MKLSLKTYVLMLSLFCSLPYSTYAENETDSKSAKDQPTVIEEIKVTATKTGATAAQDTPIAITAFSAAGLDRSGVEDLSDISLLTPSFSFSQNEQFVRLFIRGIGSSNDFLGSDPSSTVHVDGVYIARPVALYGDFLDVERIEVLRGPQGTLYGRNSVGGTINVISKLPNNESSSKARLELGTAGRIRYSAHLSGPIVEEKIMAGLSILDSRDDGHIDNLHSNKTFAPDKVLQEDLTMARSTLRILPGTNSEVILRGDFSNVGGTPSIWKAVSPAAYPFIDEGAGTDFGTTANYIANRYKTDLNAEPVSEVETWGLSAKATITTNNNYTFTSISAYRESELFSMSDIDSTELPILECCGPEEQDQFSQELQLNSPQNDKLNWVAGLYYMEENGFFGPIIAGDRNDPATVAQSPVNIDTEAFALFAEANFKISETFSITTGIRYSQEEKTIDADFTELELGGIQKDSDEWDSWTPKISIDFQPKENILWYASLSKGFKSGGFNSFQEQEAFDPEEVIAYEVGLKSDWANNTIRFNTAAFYYDYTDLQVQTLRRNTVEIANAADATVKGLEMEFNALLSDNFEVFAGLSYIDAKFDRFIASALFPRQDGTLNAAGGYDVDVSGHRLPSTPKHTYYIGGYYSVNTTGGGELAAGLDYQWQSKVYFTQFNDDITAQDSYGLLNARITYETPNQHWKIALIGKNLTDEEYYSALYELGFTSANDVWGQITKPRTIALQISAEF